MSSNETDSTENEDTEKEGISCPSLSSNELIYPTLDTVFHLVASKKSHFSFPQDGSIVFSNINVALSFVFKLIQFQDYLQEDEIVSLLQGMWISNPSGSYIQLNKMSLQLFPLDQQSSLKQKNNKPLQIIPIKFSPKSHFLFKFKENVSFQILLLKIVEEQLQNGEEPTFEDICQLAIGNGYRSPFNFQNFIEPKDFERITFFLLNCPFLNTKDGKVISLNNLNSGKEINQLKNKAEILYTVLLRNDPLRKGMSIEDIQNIVGNKIDEKEIAKIMKKDRRFFNYFGLFGIKPKISHFNNFKFNESNSHNISTLDVKNSEVFQQPNLENIVFSELYKIQSPFTIETFCSQIEGLEYYSEKRIETISPDDFEEIEKILCYLPNAIFENENIYAVPLECEIDMFGGLYLSAYENVIDDIFDESYQLLRIQTDNLAVSFLFELDRNQLPDYINPAWYKADLEYANIYPRKHKKKQDESSSKKNKKDEKEKKHHKHKKKHKTNDSDEDDENSSDSESQSKKKYKKHKKDKKSKHSSSSSDDDSEDSSFSEDSDEEEESKSDQEEEEEENNESDDDQDYNRKYKKKKKSKKKKKKKKRSKQQKPPSYLNHKTKVKSIDDIDLGTSNEEMKKINEIHTITYFYKDIKGTDQEPNPYKPPDMRDSQYLIYKAMIDRCGCKNKHKRWFFCRNIAAYLEGETINGRVMDDSDESAKIIFQEINNSKFFVNTKSEFSFIPQEEKIVHDRPVYKTFRDMFEGTVELLHKKNKARAPVFTVEQIADEMIGVQFYSKSLKSITTFNKEYKYKQPFTSIARTDSAFVWDDAHKTLGLRKYCEDFDPDEESEKETPVIPKKKRGRKSKEEKLAKENNDDDDDDENNDDNDNELDDNDEVETRKSHDINDIIKVGGALKTGKIKDDSDKEARRKARKERKEKEEKEKQLKREERQRKKEEKLRKKEEKLRKKQAKKVEEEDNNEEEENSERIRKKNSKRINNALSNLKKTRKAIFNEPIRNKNISSSKNSSNISLNHNESDDNLENDYSDYYNNDEESNDGYQNSFEQEDDYSPWPDPVLRNYESSSRSTFQDLMKEAKRTPLKDDNKPFPSFMNFSSNNDEHEDLPSRLMAIQKTEMFGDHKFTLDDQLPELMEKFGKGYSSEDFIQKVYFSLGSNYAKEFDKSLQ